MARFSLTIGTLMSSGRNLRGPAPLATTQMASKLEAYATGGSREGRDDFGATLPAFKQ